MFHRSVNGPAFHTPASEGLSAAELVRTKKMRTAHTAAKSGNERSGYGAEHATLDGKPRGGGS
jgi:hypothetical protein